MNQHHRKMFGKVEETFEREKRDYFSHVPFQIRQKYLEVKW